MFTTLYIAQKMKFSVKDFFSKCDQILNGKLHFSCSDEDWELDSIFKLGVGSGLAELTELATVEFELAFTWLREGS